MTTEIYPTDSGTVSMPPQRSRARYNCQRYRGFTLVEILLVVVIIGVMAGLASLAIGSNSARQLQQEAERLQQRLRLAQDEALLQQQNLGLRFTEQGYQLLQYDSAKETWHPVPNNLPGNGGDPSPGSLYEYTIPLTVSLQLDGAPLRLTNRQPASGYDANNRDTLQPGLLLLANGESSAFTLTLQLQSDARSTQILHSDGFSPIRRTSQTSDP